MFALERQRLLEALSPFTTLLVEHIGSTSVPGLAVKPVLDIIASVEHFPLSDEARAALALLGYEDRGEAGIAGRQFFRTNPGTRHLHVYGLGHAEFERHVRFRSYLRAHPIAARRYETLKLELAKRFRHDREAYTSGKDDLIRELLEDAQQWNQDFGPLRWLQRAMSGAPFDWLMAGGWALELFAGSVHRPRVDVDLHRPHEDVDVVVYRQDPPAMHRFLSARGWRLEKLVNARYVSWHGEPLEDDVVQLHADHPNNAAGYLDFVLTPGTDLEWQFCRDPTITRARAFAHCVGPYGLPFLAPELVLLFKSRPSPGKIRCKDALDAARVLPMLGVEQQRWLQTALERLYGTHLWFEMLKLRRPTRCFGWQKYRVGHVFMPSIRTSRPHAQARGSLRPARGCTRPDAPRVTRQACSDGHARAMCVQECAVVKNHQKSAVRSWRD